MNHENQLASILSGDFAFLRPDPQRWLIATDIESVKGPAQAQDFFACDFFVPEKDQIFRPASVISLASPELRDFFARQPAPPTFQTQWQEPDIATFADTFARLKQCLEDGQFRKAVPVVFARAARMPTRAQQLKMFASLVHAPDNVVPYGYCLRDEGIMGATPELLVKQKSPTEFETAAVAGTRAPMEGPTLLERPKDLSEHRIVIEDIAQQLQHFGSVQVEETQEVPSATLLHLKTKIHMRAEVGPAFFSVLRQLHPTAALGAFPRGPGLAWLRGQSPAGERGSFGAPFGFLDENGLGTAWVAIRNLQWRDGEARIGSGCGIVRDSDFQAEWQELALKRASVRRILGI